MKPKLLHLNKLMAAGRSHTYTRGESINNVDRGQPVLNLVRRGFVKRYSIGSDGQLNIQSIYGPGYIFSLTAAMKVIFNQSLYDGPEQFLYEAMCDTKIYSLKLASIKEAAAHNPEIYGDLLKTTGWRLSSNIQRLENLGLRTTNKRLAHQLLCLAKEFSTVTPEGHLLTIPLTHQDLADSLSVSRETVTREMQKLRNHRLVVDTDGQLIVPDINKLEQITYE